MVFSFVVVQDDSAITTRSVYGERLRHHLSRARPGDGRHMYGTKSLRCGLLVRASRVLGARTQATIHLGAL